MSKTLVVRVTRDDCDWTYFPAGKNGGQNGNKNATACRVVHRASGAVGESREYKSQLQNRQAAWKRMALTRDFERWAKIQAAGEAKIAAKIKEWMNPANLLVEFYDSDAPSN